MFRYTYPIGNLFAFFNIGFSNGITIHSTNKSLGESQFHPNIEGRALMETRGYEQGYLLGIGTKYKKYSCELRLENSNGISVYQELGTPIKRLYLLLGYRF